jgi:Reverse transcriptase (RNA-dependent DNA polymerase).
VFALIVRDHVSQSYSTTGNIIVSIKTILFADDLILTAESENDLQRLVSLLNEMSEECVMKMSPEKHNQ